MKKGFRSLGLASLLLWAPAFAGCTALSDEAAGANGPQSTKELEKFADGVFAEKMKKFNTVGSNFVVVKDGKVLLSKGYGYADKEKKISVDPSTVFQIGSVTKTFTALAALQLADQGKLNLNDDIQKYLGGLKVPNKTGKPLTMYDTLTYTSGVDMPDIVTDLSTDYINKDILMKDYLTAHMPTIVRPPGEAYTYDNFGFLLAGYAVQTVSGIPYSEYMEKNVFQPLGMKTTRARITPELVDKMAAHYGPNGELQPTVGFAPSEWPQGSVLSNGEDMAQYLIMHLNKGKYEGKEMVSPKSIELMHTYQVYADPSIPLTTVGFEEYFKELMNDEHVLLKGGNVPGHSSLIAILPEKNTAFYMSYNNDSMMSVEIYEAFMNHYFPKKTPTPPSTYTPLSEQMGKEYAGLYKNTRIEGVRTNITYEGGNLLMETGSSGKHTLKMVHPLLFEDELGNKVAFKKDAGGTITYFYYTNPKTLDIVALSQKVKLKPPFTDVPNDSPYKTHIDHLHAMDVMGAKSGNRFDPKGTMTQGEFAEVLLRAQGFHNMPYWVAGNKKLMVAGIPDYQPAAPMTRQMAAVMIQNLKHVPSGSDVKLLGQTEAWAVEAIKALVGQGIIDPDTKVNVDQSVDFRSMQTISRQEASALLDKAFGYYALPITR